MSGMNKRGAEVGNMLSIIYLLVLLAVVFIAFSWGMYLFYGQGFDLKKGESTYLVGEIKQCLSEKKVNFDNANEFYEKCNFNKNSLERNEFILRVCEDNCFTNGNKALLSIGANYQLCGFKEVRDKDAPKCSEENLEINGKNLHVVAGSRAKGSRI